MPFSGGPFYLRSGESGTGPDATSWRIRDIAPTATAPQPGNVSSRFTGTGVLYKQFKPTVAMPNNEAGLAATTEVATGHGWAILQADMNPDPTEEPVYRFFPSGNVVLTVMLAWTAADATASTAWRVQARIYKRSAAGAFTHLGMAEVNIAATDVGVLERQYTITVNVPAETTFETDETLHIEYWARGRGGALASTINDVRLHIGPIATVGTDQRVTLPGAGLKSRFDRNSPETAAASDGAGPVRRLFLPRNMPETVQGTDLTTPVARSTILGRGLIETLRNGGALPTDTLDRVYRSFRTLTENYPIGADLLARRFIGARALPAESYPTTSTLAASFRGNRSITESVPTTDAIARKFVGGRGLTESIPIGVETLIRLLLAKRGLTENIPIGTEALLRRQILIRGLPESILTVDSLNRLINVRRFVAEYPTGVTPDYAAEFPTRKIAGIVKTQDGTPIEGAIVKLFREFDDKMVQQTTSAADGSYQFLRDLYDPYDYFVVAYEEVGTPSQGLTIRGLIPVDV